MSEKEYIRNAANKYGWKKYYAVMRPVSIGTQPVKGFMDYVNYKERTEAHGKMVWAELYYNRNLTKEEIDQYELIRGQRMTLGEMLESGITIQGAYQIRHVTDEDFETLAEGKDFECDKSSLGVLLHENVLYMYTIQDVITPWQGKPMYLPCLVIEVEY